MLRAKGLDGSAARISDKKLKSHQQSIRNNRWNSANKQHVGESFPFCIRNHEKSEGTSTPITSIVEEREQQQQQRKKIVGMLYFVVEEIGRKVPM